MLPLHLQPESHIPLYIQLRDQLRSLVHAGDLRPGDRIPASRELAQVLGVHRTTVANAYAELESEGLIQGHVGRGTFIRNNGNGLKITPPAPSTLTGNSDGLRWELLFADERSEEVLTRLTASAPANALSFVMARPAEEFFPIEELQACSQAALRREGQDILNLGASDGYAPLKEALLDLLRRDGFSVKDDSLLITDGCQQALDLIAKAFVRSGDTVVLENPTYPGASAVFNGVHARCLGVPVRTHAEPDSPLGIDLEALESTLSNNRVKLLVLTPDFQNPTGTSMPLASRRRVLELAGRYQVPVVEDHIYARLHSRDERLAVVKAAGSFESCDPYRQLCQGRISRSARRLDRCPPRRNRAPATCKANGRPAHGSTRASHPRRIPEARPVSQTPCPYAQDLHRPPERAR